MMGVERNGFVVNYCCIVGTMKKGAAVVKKWGNSVPFLLQMMTAVAREDFTEKISCTARLVRSNNIMVGGMVVLGCNLRLKFVKVLLSLGLIIRTALLVMVVISPIGG